MPIEVLMPALSPTMEEGNLAKWLVKEGDTVSSGDVIAEIETDKATMEVEAVEEGKVGKLLVAEGTEGVKVNAPIALLLEEGEDESDLENYSPDGSSGDDSGSDSDEDEESDAPDEKAESGKDAAKEKAPEPVRHTKPAASDPEIPDGTDMVPTTVRDALRDAMAEEMRRDDTIFVMGEEVAEYQGAYKVTRNLLQEFGSKRVVDTPITEHGFAGLGVGAAFNGLKPDRRIHDLQLRHAGD